MYNTFGRYRYTLRESHKAYWRHTAVATANRMMRKYQERA